MAISKIPKLKRTAFSTSLFSSAMPSDWQMLTITDVADIIVSNVDKKSVKGERSVRLCNYMDVFYNRYITNSIKFMEATASEREITTYALKKDDVVFTKDSETPEDIAICASIEEDIEGLVCGYHLAIARPKSYIILGAYLAEAINSPCVHRQFVRSANGVTRFGITRGNIENIEIPLPPLCEQQKIAAILRTWDEAIEKQDNAIFSLEKIRKALLINFFYGQKLSKPIKFFAKLVAREVEKPPVAYYALGIRSHCKGTFQRYVKDASTVAMDTLYQVKENDLIVNITFAWEGAITLVKKEDEHCLVSHRFPTYEIDTSKALPKYIRHVVQTKRFIQQLGIISPGGAGRNRVLNKKDFIELKIWLPDLQTQKHIADIISTIEQKIEITTLLLEKYKNQKRGLMQKLLSGQWRVKTPNKEILNA